MGNLLAHAVDDLGWIESNPVIGTKRFKIEGDGHHTWLDVKNTAEIIAALDLVIAVDTLIAHLAGAEIALYRAHWPLGSYQRLVFELALELAARRGEITKLGPQHERPATAKAPFGKLYVGRLKGSDDTIVPISAELRAAIDACAPFPHLTISRPNRAGRGFVILP